MPALRLPRVQALGYLLMLMLLAVLPSACTRSIVSYPPAPSCWDYVPAELVKPTPGAPLPADDTAGAWVTFGNSQTGQLEAANLKPPAIGHIVQTCERKHADAVAKAERDSRRWWRR